MVVEIQESFSDIKKEWFGEWFDSPYYHILYKHRDNTEAREFLDRLTDHLGFKDNDKILDLACGKGRHSIYLNEKGFRVVGMDLSVQNIQFAKQFENDRLKFFIHDMRQEFTEVEFDYVLNMFTSFGYFDTDAENENVIREVAKALNNRGKMVLDFLNPYTVIHRLVPAETKEIDGIKFNISRWYSNNEFIYKDIKFEHNNRRFEFQEKVKAIRRQTFMNYFKKVGLKVIEIYGDYKLNKYVPEQSDRMIFLLEKI